MTDDPWAAFDGPPLAQAGGESGGSHAGQNDAWAAFDGPPLPTPVAALPAQRSQFIPAEGAANLDRMQADMRASMPPDGPQKTGMLANIGAGMQEIGAGAINIASDPVGHLILKPAMALGTLAYNGGARLTGNQPLSPETMDLMFNDGPGPGDRLVSALDRAAGVSTPADVVSGSAAQRYVRAGIVGAGQMAMVGPVGGRMEAARTLGSGTLSGLAAQGANDVLPADLAPGVSTLAGIAVPAVPSVLSAVTGGAYGAARNYLAPATGHMGPILDANGVPFMTGTGPGAVPIQAKPNQARMAGEALNAAATDPVAARAAAANVVENVPGEQPNTFQATADPGLGALHEQMSRNVLPAANTERQGVQNDARVNALKALPGDADKGALTTEAVRQADAVSASTAADVRQAEATAQAQKDAAQQAADAQTAPQRAAAQTANSAMGGDYPAGSDATVGAALRDPLGAAYADARGVTNRLYGAVPQGLNIDANVVKTAAGDVRAEQTPSSAPAPPLRARIMDRLESMPDVIPFSELRDMQRQLSEGIRTANVAGEKNEARLLGKLKTGVEQSISEALPAQAEAAPQSSSGAVANADVAAPQIASLRDAWQVEANAAARAETAAVNGPDTGRNAASGSGGVYPVDGGETSARGQSSGSSSNQGIQGAAPLEANYTPEAAAALRNANASHAENVDRFQRASGVGEVLRPGPTSSNPYALPDARVTPVIVRTGPIGADVAKAYLAAGGTPAALSDAAAFSLRQAAMPDGNTLNVGKAESWMNQRQSFLSQTPELRASIQAAVDAQRGVEAGEVGAAAKLKDATRQAEVLVKDASGRQADAITANNKSALGLMLNDAEPSARMGQIMGDKVLGKARMGQLMESIKDNPAAVAGARAAGMEWIQRELIGSGGQAGGAENPPIKSAMFQEFLKKSGPALDVLMTPEQMTGLRSVGTSLQRSAMTGQAGGGSITAQAVSGKFNAITRAIGEHMMPSSGGSVGAAIGYGTAGLVGLPPTAGATVGYAAGSIVGSIVQKAREAGITNIQQLQARALLDPALYHMLTTVVTPKNQVSLTSALSSRIGQLSLVSAARVGQSDNRRSQQP